MGYDDLISKKMEAAPKGGCLRYVGTVDVKAGTASVGLQAFPGDHSFAGTKRADNIVLFSTKRYTPQPMVLQGPGAGIPVTAGGVFADLLRQVPHLDQGVDQVPEICSISGGFKRHEVSDP